MCKVESCTNESKIRGYCKPHYRRAWDGRSLDSPLQPKNYERQPCSVPECHRICTGNLYCRECNRRWKYTFGPVSPINKNYSCIDSNGYERWNICHPKNIWGRQILAHRAMMELHLDRALLPDENVHHVNGDRLDNRIENLELWNVSQPPGQRVEDKVAWAKEILSRYV